MSEFSASSGDDKIRNSNEYYASRIHECSEARGGASIIEVNGIIVILEEQIENRLILTMR